MTASFQKARWQRKVEAENIKHCGRTEEGQVQCPGSVRAQILWVTCQAGHGGRDLQAGDQRVPRNHKEAIGDFEQKL